MGDQDGRVHTTMYKRQLVRTCCGAQGTGPVLCNDLYSNRVEESGYMYTRVDSLCRTAETNRTL